MLTGELADLLAKVLEEAALLKNVIDQWAKILILVTRPKSIHPRDFLEDFQIMWVIDPLRRQTCGKGCLQEASLQHLCCGPALSP